MMLCQQVAHEEGHVALAVPNLDKEPTMAGAGFLDSHADELYYHHADERDLTGTSEEMCIRDRSEEAPWQSRSEFPFFLFFSFLF